MTLAHSHCLPQDNRCAPQKYHMCPTVILVSALWLSCDSQLFYYGAHGYPTVHNGYPTVPNGYPGLTWVGARDTCISKKDL